MIFSLALGSKSVYRNFSSLSGIGETAFGAQAIAAKDSPPNQTPVCSRSTNSSKINQVVA
jgi:hypothetical protein